MNREELWLANELVRRGEVKLTWASPFLYIFNIATSEGLQEVYLRIRNGVDDWSCNVLWTQKDGVKWGCVMLKDVDYKKPYCRHTLACKIVLERWKDQEDEKLWQN
jgi:hypothetical protein